MKIFCIIGPCGVGKSTIIPLLQTHLNQSFEIHDFDERGVPTNVDDVWQQAETVYWLELAQENQKKEISTVICGFMMPSEIVAVTKKLGIEVTAYFLDVDKENLERRLLSRYTSQAIIDDLMRITGRTVEQFVADNIDITALLKADSIKNNFRIINTNNFTALEVAQVLTDDIQSHL